MSRISSDLWMHTILDFLIPKDKARLLMTSKEFYSPSDMVSCKEELAEIIDSFVIWMEHCDLERPDISFEYAKTAF